jgi:hypothetical protein
MKSYGDFTRTPGSEYFDLDKSIINAIPNIMIYLKFT